ncbi:MAG: PRC-barrel domain-containing protein [Thermoplasmatota archaeon]
MELLEDFKIVNSVGEDLGKVKEVFFNVDNWTVSGFEISPGIFKKDRLLKIEDVKDFRYDEKLMIVGDDFEASELPSVATRELFSFDDLRKKDVVDNQGEKIGRIYNMEIPYEKLKNLTVWKILVRTGFMERRLRIAPADIVRVMEDIKVRMSLEDIEKKLE